MIKGEQTPLKLPFDIPTKCVISLILDLNLRKIMLEIDGVDRGAIFEDIASTEDICYRFSVSLSQTGTKVTLLNFEQK